MGDTREHILKRKMAAAGRDPGPLHLIADLSARMGAEAAAAFSEYYGEKCQLGDAESAQFTRLDEALAPFASASGIYHFRIDGDADFVIVLDTESLLRAAGWSLAATRDLPDPLPESVSAIDRRLAKKLVVRTAQILFEKAGASGLVNGGVELIASGADPRRFDFTDAAQRVVSAGFSIQTIDGEALGAVRIFAAERSTQAMREYYETTVVRAKEKWKQDLRRLAALSPVALRADLAAQEVALGALMDIQPGQVINLSSATIDEISVKPALPTASALRLSGALGNRDGARALRIKEITY